MPHDLTPPRSSPRARRVLLRLGIGSVLAALTLGIVAWRLAAPPGEPPDYSGARPALADDGYVSVTHSIHIDAAPEHVWASGNDPNLSLEDIVQFDNGFPAVETTQPLVGDWIPGDRAGDRRWVRFEDAHYLAEEVLVDDHDVFRYQIWGFTSMQRFAVRHGVAEFRYQVEGDGTRLSWTYSLLPTTPILSGALRAFLDSTMTPMMQATLAGLRDRAEA
ncbi:SRPBCC family protein [Occultella aeris]|uniref:Polyketide cyclase / dehydrase and lipid transport n=1 Tax=Occultella aeris TaxID=2761496 RepID=A0A7M4DGL9_9MICO|nr:SRPBCC family protein [Occultella aeris]VZO36062.1 Polyketide cyclase / dehydrase and lipid transport [Occultella aeris]